MSGKLKSSSVQSGRQVLANSIPAIRRGCLRELELPDWGLLEAPPAQAWRSSAVVIDDQYPDWRIIMHRRDQKQAMNQICAG
jgi:hypothetical protein